MVNEQDYARLLAILREGTEIVDNLRKASENATKLVSEPPRTNSEDLRTSTKDTKNSLLTNENDNVKQRRPRSEAQIAAYQANFKKRWAPKATKNSAIYDDMF